MRLILGDHDLILLGVGEAAEFDTVPASRGRHRIRSVTLSLGLNRPRRAVGVQTPHQR
jgi:hypothetical protein